MAKAEESHWWYRSLHEFVEHQIRRFFAHWRPAQIRLLDAGCGTGKMAERLQNLGFQTVAADLSPTAVSYTRSRGVRDVFSAPLHLLPFRDASYDGVICLDVIYQLDRQLFEKSLKEFFRVLRPGGFVFIQWATYESLRSAHDAAVGTVRRYSRDEGLEVAHLAGFDVAFVTHRYFLLFPVMALVKRFRRRAAGDDHGLPPIWINDLLTWSLRMERLWFGRRSLPAGTSVFAVLRKPRG